MRCSAGATRATTRASRSGLPNTAWLRASSRARCSCPTSLDHGGGGVLRLLSCRAACATDRCCCFGAAGLAAAAWPLSCTPCQAYDWYSYLKAALLTRTLSTMLGFARVESSAVTCRSVLLVIATAACDCNGTFKGVQLICETPLNTATRLFIAQEKRLRPLQL
jgi:hypothetical protein